MEKPVGCTRKYTGKKYKAGVVKKVEIVFEEIPNRPTKEITREELRDEWLNDNSPFNIGFGLIHSDVYLWHPTNKKIIGDDENKQTIHVEPNSFKLPDNESLNSDTPKLFYICIGESVKMNYCRVHYMNTLFRVDRSEKTVPQENYGVFCGLKD